MCFLLNLWFRKKCVSVSYIHLGNLIIYGFNLIFKHYIPFLIISCQDVINLQLFCFSKNKTEVPTLFGHYCWSFYSYIIKSYVFIYCEFCRLCFHFCHVSCYFHCLFLYIVKKCFFFLGLKMKKKTNVLQAWKKCKNDNK